MNLSIKKLPKSQIEIKIEVPAEDFDNFFKEAVSKLGENLEINGFRKGKAPKSIVEEKIGLEKILSKAAEIAINSSYKEAVHQLTEKDHIDVISHPEIQIQKIAKGNPFVFLAKVFVFPEIKLPDYKDISVKTKKDVLVSEKEIDDALSYIQKSRANLTLKEGVAQNGDFIEIEYSSPQIKGIEPNGKTKDAFILGEGKFIPNFEENLVGMKAGETKKFSIDIPEGNKLRQYGKKIDFSVEIKSVKKINLPKIDDQFAKSLGNFENLEALKKSIREGITVEKKEAESKKIREEILEKISDLAECELPEILVRNEQKRIMNELKNNISGKFKMEWNEYLEKMKKTEEEIMNSFLSQAEKNVKKLLILKEIGKREKVEISDEEISKKIEEILSRYQNPEDAQKNIGLDPQELKLYTKEIIENEKTLALLEKLIKE